MISSSGGVLKRSQQMLLHGGLTTLARRTRASRCIPTLSVHPHFRYPPENSGSLGCWLRAGIGWLETDAVPEPLEASDEPPFDLLTFALVEIRAAELVIGCPLGQDVVDDHQDGMPERDQRALLPAPCCNPSVLGRQIGLLCLGGNMGDLNQHLAQPDIPFAGFPTQTLATAFLVAWAHAGPGRQMLSARKAAQVAPKLGHHNLGREL